MDAQPLASPKRGRPQSIPPEMWGTVFRLHSQGHGYRRIADLLIPLHVSTTKSSVERLIKGLPPYLGRRVVTQRIGPEGHVIRVLPIATLITPPMEAPEYCKSNSE